MATMSSTTQIDPLDDLSETEDQITSSKYCLSEEDYVALIEGAVRERRFEVISNGKARHAVFIITKMFSIADRTVEIYSGKLAATVSHNDDVVAVYGAEDLLKAVCHFLKQEGTSLSILVENAHEFNPDDHPIVQKVNHLKKANKLHGKVSIRAAAQEQRPPNHFMVVDRVAYREENDHSNARALANFCDPIKSSRLSKSFQDAFSKGREVYCVCA